LPRISGQKHSLAIVKEITLFDEYRGKGLKDNEKSLAFRFLLQDTRQTLSDEQIEQTMAAYHHRHARQIWRSAA
jgi:phenylalanyl-tRNA synthetase beta subunit